MNDAALLQNIAMEMNLSETAFLCQQGREYRLRWFTPRTEVALCGHATLSAAHILWEKGLENKGDVIQFDTLSGKLLARFRQNKVELDFPIFEVKEITGQANINAALCVEPLFTGTSRGQYLIEVKNYAVLKAVQPDFSALKKAGQTAFILTCRSEDPDYDFYSRFFDPAEGIDEDPVTGSSQSTLAPYWSRKLGKKRLMCYQASPRGGILECELSPEGRVLIRGDAVTVFEMRMTRDEFQVPSFE
jgi:PhzF family phenazine biosynthesis protein